MNSYVVKPIDFDAFTDAVRLLSQYELVPNQLPALAYRLGCRCTQGWGTASKATSMSLPLRVLFLEDRESDARLLLNELRGAGFEPDWKRIDTESAFSSELTEGWQIILADDSLPQFDALRALRLVRDSKSDIPVIIVSGKIGDETAVAVMKEGAADYLLKDRLGRLGPAVTQALG